jgi:uncharacterized membrane protein HdeD (DUF308 family)
VNVTEKENTMAETTETLDPNEQALNAKVLDLVRTWGVVAGSVAIAVGLYGLIFPTSTLKVIGLLFGVFLVVTGITHLGTALGSSSLSTGWRWFQGVLGALVVVAGVIALNNPFDSLAALTIVAGLGWIVDGIATLSMAFGPRWSERRWGPIVVGVLAIIAGIVLIVVPNAVLSSFLFVGSLLLVGVGVGTVGTFLALGSSSKKEDADTALDATAATKSK